MTIRPSDSRILAASLKASQLLAPGPFLECCVETLAELMGAGSVLAYQRISGGSDLELRMAWPEEGTKGLRPPPLVSGALIATAGEEGGAADPSRMRPGGSPWPRGPGT